MKQKLVVIYYHEVVESGQGFSYQKIEKDKFEQQMKYLQEHHYQTLLFEDLDKPLPEKSIIVSLMMVLKVFMKMQYRLWRNMVSRPIFIFRLIMWGMMTIL